MFIKISWNTTDDLDALTNLYQAWENFTRDKLKSSGKAHQLMYEAGEELSPISNDGNSGVVILHNSDGEPLSVADEQARAFALTINSQEVQKKYFSTVKSIKAAAIQESTLQKTITAEVITEEDIVQTEAAVLAKIPELSLIHI